MQKVYHLPNEKPCIECGDVKNTDKDFYASAKALDGRLNTCKVCLRKRNREHNKEKKKERELYAI